MAPAKLLVISLPKDSGARQTGGLPLRLRGNAKSLRIEITSSDSTYWIRIGLSIIFLIREVTAAACSRPNKDDIDK